jgi:xanthine dehydrogenase accessory factor
MRKQLSIWKFIREGLIVDEPTMLLYVLESKGSSPGRQGFFMAVNVNGDMEGSIGGGIMEHKFVELAKEKLQNQDYKIQLRKQVHDKSATKDRSGMICSGEQMILMYTVSRNDLQQVLAIIRYLEKNKNGMMELSPNGIRFSPDIPGRDYHFEFKSEEAWLYQEKTGYKNDLYIVGGGHCALAFSRIMGMMDFYIRLFEERKGLNTVHANEWAHEKKIVDSFADLKNLIPSGPNAFVVIMSFGYRTDGEALRALLGKQFKYLGLLGSRKKIEEMFEQFRKEGVAETELKNIHSPIGLSIKSQTPEEIAISIAAEIIAVKNTL